MISNTFKEARKNAIYKFSDSYGVNHTADSAGITVAWAFSIWDVNIDTYKYENDQEEPVSFYPFHINFNNLLTLQLPCKIDSFADPEPKKIERFDEENMVDTTFAQLPKDQRDKVIQ